MLAWNEQLSLSRHAGRPASTARLHIAKAGEALAVPGGRPVPSAGSASSAVAAGAGDSWRSTPARREAEAASIESGLRAKRADRGSSAFGPEKFDTWLFVKNYVGIPAPGK